MTRSCPTKVLSRAAPVGALLVCVAAMATLASGTAAARTGAAFTIRSSLDGKAVLPHRVRWVAHPSGPVSFPGVEFLIDGKLVFANRIPPFAFGDDANDERSGSVKTGFLVTAWLSPGKHRFTVRARGMGANRATTAERTVVARVTRPPAPPAALAGTWQRELTTAVPPDRTVLYRAVTAQPGTYRMAIGRPYIRMSGPAPRKHLNVDYVAGPSTITLGGPVWTGDPDEDGSCEPWGPDAGYAWTVEGDTLTLAPARPADTCKQRAAIVTGEWTRVR
jgi:hypothetical protein